MVHNSSLIWGAFLRGAIYDLRTFFCIPRRVGVPVVVGAGTSDVPTTLTSGAGPETTEKPPVSLNVCGAGISNVPSVLMGGTGLVEFPEALSVAVGEVASVFVSVGSALPSVAVAVAVELSNEMDSGAGETFGAVLFPESVGAGTSLLLVGYTLPSVGSGRLLESVSVGSMVEYENCAESVGLGNAMTVMNSVSVGSGFSSHVPVGSVDASVPVGTSAPRVGVSEPLSPSFGPSSEPS
jgi:hypothetical protein